MQRGGLPRVLLCVGEKISNSSYRRGSKLSMARERLYFYIYRGVSFSTRDLISCHENALTFCNLYLFILKTIILTLITFLLFFLDT